ncbi:phosphatidylinositol alpha-1,6-mannosyltransferase [Extensimonas vulgaris]|uniref:Phosphatidylinositol alpha-1,6-mannosyltransferase n=2 Tax=Extensimonas vulgaris TaxID=1031594 RepID=A0A369APG9_9BURK|nr:phosphatidylinositol alpha-1,6-mannosyltransferase [Extensimonas vulgaris]TWI39737.1 phosphatidylinositol alpha-1,6-mannosyltransferase [Extensimonas vulgaris]
MPNAMPPQPLPARTRVLLVTRNFPPLLGGMERLNWHLAAELGKRHPMHVIAPAGAAAQAPTGVTVEEVPLKPLWRFVLAAGWRAFRAARRDRPAVVLAGSGLTAPLAWLAARCAGARAVAYVHGLDITVPHALYRRLWLPALRRVDAVIANSHATAALAAQAGIAPQRIHIVHPGVQLPPASPAARPTPSAHAFRAAHGLGDAPLLLSVGRLTARKGLREFVTEVLPRIAAERPDVRLLVIGDAPANALYGQAQTPAAIQSAAAVAGVAQHVIFLGKVSEEELAAAYQAAQVHAFPIRALPNDPEGFGMVAIEAAVHGLPTVAYAAGGVVDAVAHGQSGSLVPPGDAAAFADAVLQLLAKPLDEAGIHAFARGFAWEAFGERVERVLGAGT